MEGVDVLRVPLYPSHDSNALGRIANFSSFALSAATIGAMGIGGRTLPMSITRHRQSGFRP